MSFWRTPSLPIIVIGLSCFITVLLCLPYHKNKDMNIKTTVVKEITLDSTDLKQAIILYLKGRAERDIEEKDIILDPDKVSATITLTDITENPPK